MCKSNKKNIAIICAVVLGILSFITFLVITAFKTDKAIALKDSKGEVFATVEWNGTSENYVAEEEFVKAYAAAAFNEAVKIVEVQEKLEAEKSKKYFFDNVTELKTNFDRDFSLRLKDAFEKREGEEFSCEMAITDLNGKLIAVFSTGNEEQPYSVSNNYVGSAIKPFSVFAPAIETGRYNWSSMIVDSPVSQVMDENGEYKDWPVNANDTYTYENVALVDALMKSTNTVAVKLLQEVGVKKSIGALENRYAFNLDYEKKKVTGTSEDEVLGNIALGYLYKGASVIDMAGNFQVFANGGLYTKPVAVDEIINGETSLYKAEYESKRVLSQTTAEIMNKMLQLVVRGGTGKNANINGVKVGGKTGTTTGNEDNWFVGFTPEYTCAVWHSVTTSGNIAPDIFADVFEGVEVENNNYPHIGNVVSKPYCQQSGKLRGKGCKFANRGYFASNNLPEVCDECK